MERWLKTLWTKRWVSVQFSLLSRVQFCDAMDCMLQASLSIANSRSLLKLMPITLLMPSNCLILCQPLLLPPSIFPESGSFPMSQFFTLGGQGIGVSALASVLPMNIQDWFPLGWTGWIFSQESSLLPSIFECASLACPALAGRFFNTSTTWEVQVHNP